MEIRCEGCRAVIQIPDKRVPQNGAFHFNCPRCKQKILATSKSSETPGEARIELDQPSSPSKEIPLRDDDLEGGLPESMDRLQPGQSAALLCVNGEDHRVELKAMLEALAYVVDIPAAAEQTLQRLRFNQYHVILLDDDFEAKSPNSVASYLAGLNMNIRRDMFVVLIGQRFKTADHLQAFMESVNLVLHPDDLPQLATFLNRGVKDHARFYKVFTECLIETGKKI